MSEKQGIQLGAEQGNFLSRVRVTLARRTEGRALILLLLVAIGTWITEPVVFTAYAVTLGRIALIGLVALGLTAVILMGELDLSVASTLALTGVVMASVDNLATGILAALAVGLIIGAINAFFVVVVGINSFIATLGMLFFLRGAAFVISNEEPVRLVARDTGIAFGKPWIGPLTPRMIIFILAFIALQVYVTRVRSGREFYAVGGNREAAYDAGIPVRRRIFTGFMISGFVAAMAGVINTLERTAADPTAGSTVLLASFAARDHRRCAADRWAGVDLRHTARGRLAWHSSGRSDAHRGPGRCSEHRHRIRVVACGDHRPQQSSSGCGERSFVPAESLWCATCELSTNFIESRWSSKEGTIQR